MNSRENSLLLLYIIIDLVLLNLSILIAHYFNLGYIQDTSDYGLRFYMLQANLAWIITYFGFAKTNLYLRDTYWHRLIRISKRMTGFVIALVVLTFVLMKGDVGRAYMLCYIVIFGVLEVASYGVIYSYLRFRRSQGWHTKRIAIVGYTETSTLLRTMIDKDPMLGYKFIGYVKYDARDINEIPEEDRSCILGNTSELEQIIKDNNIEVVFSVFSFLQNKSNTYEYLKICNHIGVRLYLVAENQRWLRKNRGVESIGDLYILNPQHIPLDDLGNLLGKRFFDIAFSSTVILLTCWNLLPIIVFLIKTTSKGPVFFIQERTGLNNQSFRCYKFRSMRVNKDSNRKQATANDSRITRLGRFMRKWNIDELPQFFNVLCGHMSVVGPRPHMLSHTEQYSELIKHYMVRHYVKPGITGWAQVNGLRGETDELWKMEKRVKYDMDYVENWTFLWDLEIVAKTLFKSLQGDQNAY
jgi:Undecaprenyl-phosphate glucose phosphotransferase